MSELKEDSCSSVTMDGSVMARAKALTTCDDASNDCKIDSMLVQESSARDRTISWVMDLPEKYVQKESDQTPNGIPTNPLNRVTPAAPESHTRIV